MNSPQEIKPDESENIKAPKTSMAGRSLDEIKTKTLDLLFRGIQIEEVNKLPEESRRLEIRLAIERILDGEEVLLSLQERSEIVEDLLDEILGLGPLEKLLRDSSISDILINNAKVIFVERQGRLEEAGITFRNDQHLKNVIDRIVSRVGRRVDESSPMVDARLSDGSRVNAIVPPVALDGPAMSIRRFGKTPLRLTNLIANNSLAPEMAFFLEAATKARQSFVISGGTGSGKTTLLNVFSAFIPPHERIITIEDAAELQLQRRHVVRLETRPPSIEGKGQITMRDLVRNALRMRPDRIIIGECRGGEALDMLQAMNTGHEGSMTTLHANSPRDALARLETMVMMSGFEMPIKVMRHQISSALRLIVQADRVSGGARKVTSITEVIGMEGDVIIMQEIFAYRQRGVDIHGRARGYFEATGVRPHLTPRLQAAGIEIPPDLFVHKILVED